MKQILLAITLLCLAAIACGAAAPKAKTADDYVNEYGGNLESYQTILSMTDCATLQEQFDTASANNKREQAGTPQFKATLGYMTAADDRMKELKCYGNSGASATVDISLVVEQTSKAAIAQTQLASSPTTYFTSTYLPTLTQSVTLTPTEILLPSSTVVFIFPTDQPGATVAPVLPTNPPASGLCSCSGDTLNCGDFSSQASAQACFDYCMGQGRGDIHKLDGDNDGIACEGLP